MNNTKITGNLGEDIACRYLKRMGFHIITRNYWKKWGEIDIVAKHSGITHFIEVKSVTRENLKSVSDETSNGHRPEDNMHERKLQRLGRVIQSYIAENAVSDETWQFDVITVCIDYKNLVSKVNILENIVL